MKFLCDADRCIECNACVTACKNENEVPWGINRRRVVTINDGKPGERSVSMACMHCTDAPCAAVCPVNCFYTTADGVVLHSKDLCIGCGYCFYACPFGAPQYPRVGNFGTRGKMDKCTYCAGGPEADNTEAEYVKYGANRLAEGKLHCAPRCARPNRCWPATARSSRRFTRTAWPSAATAPAPGAGRRPTARPSRPEGVATMTTLIARIRIVVLALAVLAIGGWRLRALQTPSGAQQVNPTADAIKEQELLKELNKIDGRCTIPDQKACTIEQPAGRGWRQFHEGTLKWIGAIAVIGMLGLLIGFYLIRGMIKIEAGRSGRVLGAL